MKLVTRGTSHEIERPGRRSSASLGPAAARVVVVEDGASLRELEPPPDGCEHTVMIVQGRGEAPAGFAQRVRRRLRKLAEERHALAWAVVLLGPRGDEEAQAARLLIGCALNRHAEALPTASSVLALHAPAAAQAWVLELMDRLRLELECSALSIHVRFDQPRRTHDLPELPFSALGLRAARSVARPQRSAPGQSLPALEA